MSSNKIALTVSQLHKTYQIYGSARKRLLDLLLPGRPRFGRPFEALKPLSFTLNAGEAMGVIGKNGSGKSTLLQMLAGTLTPTGGSIECPARIAALLELGAGFNSDFTGRENLYLNAAILGIPNDEIAAKEASILDFAEIGEFIDQPLSTYSSGMVVRLAFAIATSSRPDVLIVDEALSVGDEAFQQKCFRRIRQMQKEGMSLLFVSHSAQAIVQLCQRCIWLENGQMQQVGSAKEVTEAYHRRLHEQDLIAAPATTQPATDYSNNGGEISDIRLLNSLGQPESTLHHGQHYRFCYRLTLKEGEGIDPATLRAGMLIKTRTGIEIAGSILAFDEFIPTTNRAAHIYDFQFTFHCLLYPGKYYVNCGVQAERDGKAFYIARKLDALQLNILHLERRNRHGTIPEGLVDLDVSGAIIPLPQSTS